MSSISLVQFSSALAGRRRLVAALALAGAAVAALALGDAEALAIIQFP